MTHPQSIKTALLSVSDKTNLIPLAQALQAQGVLLLSTGGTAKALLEAGLEVTEVADYTGFPEILGGRVKTLHPKIHAGLLHRQQQDAATLKQHDIKAIDLLVVNLYPFEQTINNQNHTLADAIEHIDIGGPTMLRAAAKNYHAVTVLTDPNDYAEFLDEYQSKQTISQTSRFKFARRAFARIAAYDAAISNYLSSYESEDSRHFFPDVLTKQVYKQMDLRYGENPHQKAAFYIEPNHPEICIAHAKQLQGKMLSFNNLADADCALECVKQFPLEKNTCVIVKHANPCGVAFGNTIQESYLRAYEADPESAFGGVIAFNQTLNEETAQAIIAHQFVEVVIAPEISTAAQEAFKAKPNVRLLITGLWDAHLPHELDLRHLPGGLLVQETDLEIMQIDKLKQVTQKGPDESQFQDLLFAWQVAKFVKSNAIVYAKNGQTLGIGVGQTSRVTSAQVGVLKAQQSGFDLRGAVVASDAFFPFRDGVDMAAKSGISAIIQPGGSVRDAEIIAAANEHDIAMVFTGIRHFRH